MQTYRYVIESWSANCVCTVGYDTVFYVKIMTHWEFLFVLCYCFSKQLVNKKLRNRKAVFVILCLFQCSVCTHRKHSVIERNKDKATLTSAT